MSSFGPYRDGCVAGVDDLLHGKYMPCARAVHHGHDLLDVACTFPHGVPCPQAEVVRHRRGRRYRRLFLSCVVRRGRVGQR